MTEKIHVVRSAEKFIFETDSEVIGIEKFLEVMSDNPQFVVLESITNNPEFEHSLEFHITKKVNDLNYKIYGSCSCNGQILFGVLCEMFTEKMLVRYLYGFNKDDVKYFPKLKEIILKVIIQNQLSIIIKFLNDYNGEMLYEESFTK